MQRCRPLDSRRASGPGRIAWQYAANLYAAAPGAVRQPLTEDVNFSVIEQSPNLGGAADR